MHLLREYGQPTWHFVRAVTACYEAAPDLDTQVTLG